MGYLSAGKTFAATKTNGFTVQETITTAALGAANGTDTTVHNAINIETDDILGKKILVGVDIKSVYRNGTAAVGGTMTFTFDTTASTISGAPDGKTITLTSTDGEERTYTIRERVQATKVDAINASGLASSSSVRMTFTVPTASGGEGTAISMQMCNDTNGSTSAGSGVIGIGTSGASDGTVAEAIRDAINGDTNSRVHFGSGTSASGVVGLSAALGSSGTVVTLTATNAGTSGNDIAIANTTGSAASAGNLAGGTGINTLGKREFDAGSTVSATATNFKNALDDSVHGHGTARLTTVANAGSVLGKITVTQVTTGTAGNTAISGNFADICSTDPPNFFADGAAATTVDLGISYSHNGTDWTSANVIASDIAADATGVKLFEADLTTKSGMPYARLEVNTGGVTMADSGLTTGTHSALYVYK